MTRVVEVRIELDVEDSRVGYARAVLETDDGMMMGFDGFVIFMVDGRLGLAYPKRDKKRDIAYFNPLNKQTAALFEEAIFGQLVQIKNLTFD